MFVYVRNHHKKVLDCISTILPEKTFIAGHKFMEQEATELTIGSENTLRLT